jgi:phosphoglycerate dehydrogenase-like enzyme
LPSNATVDPASPTQSPPERLRVVVGDANLTPHKALFEANLPSGTIVSWHDKFDEAAVLPDLPGAHVFVGPRFTSAMGEVANALRLVHVAGAGYDGISAEALRPGVLCANTFHHEQSMAEYVAAATVVVRRQLHVQDRELRQGHWASPVYEPERPQLSTLEGATIGVVGYGHIGARTWQLMRAFGARGIAVTSHPIDLAREGLAWSDGPDALHRLLTESDVVVLCLPLLPRTRHLIGREQLGAMKRGAVIVNVSRGPLIEPEALYHALSQQKIGGAVLDVWYDYPTSGAQAEPAPYRFGELENVFMTPHISGVTRQTFEGRIRDVTANIGRLQAGEPLRNLVTIR